MSSPKLSRNDDSNSSSPPAKRALLNDPSPSATKITNTHKYSQASRLAIKFTHQWTIENFSYYCLKDNKDENAHPCILSSIFHSPTNQQFQLSLYPRGTDDQQNVSLILTPQRAHLAYKCNFSIVGPSGRTDIITDGGGCRAFRGNSSLCFRFTVNLDTFLAPSSGYIFGDVVTFLCTIEHDDVKWSKWSFDYDKLGSTQLEHNYADLCSNDSLSDVVLVFGSDGEKKQFAAHKAILGARSEVFATMFENDIQGNQVNIPDVDPTVGQVFLKYIYSNQVDSLGENAEMLLIAADKYQLSSLKAICEGFLCFRLNSDSVFQLLLLADTHNALLLRSNAIEYIRCHSGSLTENDAMKCLILNRPKLFIEVFPGNASDCVIHQCWSPAALNTDSQLFTWSYTPSRVIKCLHRWSIEKFCTYYLTAQYKNNNNSVIESFIFAASDENDVQFCVKLHLHEVDSEQDHLSLYLQLKSAESSAKVAVKLRVSILVNGDKWETMEISKILFKGDSIGWPKYIELEKLMKNSQFLLGGAKENKLVLHFQVFYIADIYQVEPRSGQNTFAHKHQLSMAHDFSGLYKSGRLTDAQFVLTGGKVLKVHKTIMSTQSNVFARLFKNKFRVKICAQVDVQAFEQMIQLIYGQMDGLKQCADKVWSLLDKYQIDSLKNVCEMAMFTQVQLSPSDSTSIVNLLCFADKHNAQRLKNKIIEHIHSKPSIVKDTLKENFKQKNPNLFYDVLSYKLRN